MPCGGIFPIDPKSVKGWQCWQCGKTDPPPDHVLIEWDSFLHGTCVEPFLATEEGQIVLDHGHGVIAMQPDGTKKMLHREVGDYS